LDVSERRRYEATVDGELAGYLMYRREAGLLTLVHTQVKPQFEGRGIGGLLALAALDQARVTGTKVRLLCPFVSQWLERHPEYLDLVHWAEDGTT
jgi:uncharacterized protein